MALFKRDDVWWMRFTHKGKQIRKSTGVTDKRTADVIYAKTMTQLVEGRWLETEIGSQKTLSELLEKYMRVHSKRYKSENSYIRDQHGAKKLLHRLGDPILSKISAKDISNYKNDRLEEGASPSTVVKELNLLSHAFNLAINEWEWLQVNPVRRVSKPKVMNCHERWLSHDEEKALLATSPQWLREIILFALHTGFRRGEILSLTWPRVDLFRKTVTFQAHDQKNRSQTTVPLNATALSVLIGRARVKHIKTPLVFYSEADTKISGNNVRRAFVNAVKRAGISGFRFHDLRHTFATRLVQAGVDIYTVQKLGRWRTISMVMRYAHHQTESLRSGIEVLDNHCAKISTVDPESREMPTKISTILAQSENSGEIHGR